MKKLILIPIFLSITLYTLILKKDIFILDRFFLPDDTYYTLTIARNIAAGCGPSMDCEILTSGFQPLISAFLIPIFFITDDIYTPIYFAITISVIFGMLTSLMASLIFYKMTNSILGSILFSIFLITNPFLIDNYFNGLETTLASFLCLLAIYQILILEKNDRIIYFIFLGLIIGLSILARIDSSIIALFIGLYLLSKFSIDKVIIITTSSLITVSPIWVYNFMHFGTVIPESGRAVKLITEYHTNIYLKDKVIIEKSISSFNIFGDTIPISFSIILIIAAMLFYIFKSYNEKKFNPLILLVLSALSTFALYTFYMPAYWFFNRYFNLAYVFVIIISFLFIFTILNKKNSYTLFLFFISLNFYSISQYFKEPDNFHIAATKGTKGYAKVSQQIVASLPKNSTLGAMQSGAITYFSNNKHRIYNLDGVVNGEVFPYIQNKTIDHYFSKHQIDYFADWYFNKKNLLSHSNKDSIQLNYIKRFDAQGKDYFELYKIDK